MRKCDRCGSNIKDNKYSEMELTPKSHPRIGEYRWMLLCEKCSAWLVQWLASGDPIQARINKEEEAK